MNSELFSGLVGLGLAIFLILFVCMWAAVPFVLWKIRNMTVDTVNACRTLEKLAAEIRDQIGGLRYDLRQPVVEPAPPVIEPEAV